MNMIYSHLINEYLNFFKWSVNLYTKSNKIYLGKLTGFELMPRMSKTFQNYNLCPNP